jgi:tetratricopeptide (TPR) repeat protein
MKSKNFRLLLVASVFFLVAAGGGCAFVPAFDSRKEVRFNRGLAYEALGEYRSSADCYEIVVNSSRSNYKFPADESVFRLARIYSVQLNNPDSAVFYYRKFLSEVPESNRHPRVLIEFANYYRDLGQVDQSLDIYKDFRERYPDSKLNQEVYYNKGKVHLKKGEPDLAAQEFELLLEKYPNGNLADGACYYLARTYGKMDNKVKQLKYYKKILNEFPASDLREISAFRAIKLALELGQEEEARRIAEKYRSEFEQGSYQGDIEKLLSGEEDSD